CIDRTSADVTLGVTADPDPVIVGHFLTNTIWVTNLGPATATGVIVTNPLPFGATFLSATASQGSCSNNGSAYVCSLGSIASNGIATITIGMLPSVPGPLTNIARIVANQAD